MTSQSWQPIENVFDVLGFELMSDPECRLFEDAIVYGPMWGGEWDESPFDGTGGWDEDDKQIAIASTYEGQGFWTVQPAIQDYEYYIRPTHWMPLPEVPE